MANLNNITMANKFGDYQTEAERKIFRSYTNPLTGEVLNTEFVARVGVGDNYIVFPDWKSVKEYALHGGAITEEFTADSSVNYLEIRIIVDRAGISRDEAIARAAAARWKGYGITLAGGGCCAQRFTLSGVIPAQCAQKSIEGQLRGGVVVEIVVDGRQFSTLAEVRKYIKSRTGGYRTGESYAETATMRKPAKKRARKKELQPA